MQAAWGRDDRSGVWVFWTKLERSGRGDNGCIEDPYDDVAKKERCQVKSAAGRKRGGARCTSRGWEKWWRERSREDKERGRV